MNSKGIFLIFSSVCFVFYLYGIFTTVISISSRKNDCRMTFMFEHPNFVKINFKENDKYPNYNLYAYSEGVLTENARNMFFSGAPVLFVPGNSGSYKQTRSLASVALRKGIDNDWFQHLDYFAVDLNEEYSALFGGVLEGQTQFIEHCIRAILKLYEKLPNPPKQIVIVGHSIGGKIAQKLLASPDTAPLINTVIALASPLDKPVLNWDLYIDSYYESIENYWTQNRQVSIARNNSCGHPQRRLALSEDETRILDDKLLITIGGGDRDLMVTPGLTDSKFSDLHVMTTGIPKVWVETDHLCVVWCHQLVLIINRFLYSIIAPTKYKGPTSKGLSFINDKAARLSRAEQFFVGLPSMQRDGVFRKMESPENADWYEDNRRIFTEHFKAGLNKTRIQMIRLVDNVLYHTLRVDVLNLETHEWVLGCEAIDTTGKSRYCAQAKVLPKHHISRLPSNFPDRHLVLLNLHQLKKENPKWSHVLLKFEPTREPFQFTVDIHNPSDRQIKVTMPKWYSFGTTVVLDDSLLGASHYQLEIIGLDETHQALELSVKTKNCQKPRTIAKVCVPWADGFDRFHQFPDDEGLMIWTPKSRPINYNTSTNPILVDVYLDHSCRYSLSVHQSFSQMIARIVQQFSHWLPANLVAIICLAIKHQISLTPKGEKFKCGSFYKALATCSPFFIVTVTRLFYKFILMLKILPKPETLPTSLTVAILIHGTSVALLGFLTVVLWAGITFFASMAHKLLFKITKLPFPVISDTILSIIEKVPITATALLVSLAFASCGGIALVTACLIYFILLSKMYEDYLETFVFKTAKAIAMKLFGRERKSKDPKIDQLDPKEEVDKGETSDSNALEKTEKRQDDQPKDEDHLSKDENDQSKDEDRQSKESTIEEKTEDDIAVERIYEEAIQKQREEKAKRDQELALARAEYDSISEGLSEINFHLPLFFLLLMLTILSLPSVVTWAKNFHHSKVLTPDPTLIPATCVLIALGIIWQLPTPRNLMFYKVIGSALYVAAVVSVLYCQDAIYRVSYVIVGVFILIALHQFLSPKEKEKKNNKEEEQSDLLDDLKSNYDRFKTVKGFFSK